MSFKPISGTRNDTEGVCGCTQVIEEPDDVMDIDGDEDDDEDEQQLIQLFSPKTTNVDENNNAVSFIEEHSYCGRENVLTFQNEHGYSSQVPCEKLEMLQSFDKALLDYLQTPQHGKAIDTCKVITDHRLSVTWYTNQKAQVQKIFDDSCQSEPGNFANREFTEFYKNFNTYLMSEEFCNHPFEDIPFASNILTSVMFEIQDTILNKKASSVKIQYTDNEIFPPQAAELSDAGKGKIRYVGGYCLAKVRYRLGCLMHNHLYISEKESDIDVLNKQIEYIDKMTISYTDIYLTTKYQDTLKETERKQNTCESLVNISDSVFEFFEVLDSKLRHIMTKETLMKTHKLMYRYILNSVLSDELVKNAFLEKCINFQEAGIVLSMKSIAKIKHLP